MAKNDIPDMIPLQNPHILILRGFNIWRYNLSSGIKKIDLGER